MANSLSTMARSISRMAAAPHPLTSKKNGSVISYYGDKANEEDKHQGKT